MEVTYFRPRRPGPEAFIEDIVVNQIPQLFATLNFPSWTAGSLPIGAGMPDLIVVSYYPQVFALAHGNLSNMQILAYLRAVGRVRLSTIADRMHISPIVVNRSLSELVDAKAVAVSANTFSLSPLWREILPEVVTIEVKVSNWQRAVNQAGRNRVLAHRSFVALPTKVAQRIRSKPIFQQLGIGLISVDDDATVSVLRRPRRRQPAVWAYYYQLASKVAKSFQN